MLILFLSSQDFSPPSRRRVEAAHGARDGLVKHREDVKDKIIVDLSSSNELLEIENRKLKVAAIGLMAELRELGKPATAEMYNLTGLGVYAGGDALGDDAKTRMGKQSDALASPRKGTTPKHVDEGMRAREALREQAASSLDEDGEEEEKREGVGSERRALAKKSLRR